MIFFEEKVLKAIKKIPKGKVTTYQEIAKAIARPKAVRAVGNAVKKNPCAPKVPCHRVVKTNGSIGGYKGGTKQKIVLLKKESIKIKQGKIVDFTSVTFKF